MTPLRLRRPRLVARRDGAHGVRCANLACGRRLPGVWLVPLDQHVTPVLDRAWYPTAAGVLRLRGRARHHRDFLNGRALSEYAEHGRPAWRRPNYVTFAPLPPLACPHCGAPQTLPPPACGECTVGGAHATALHAAVARVLESERLI